MDLLSYILLSFLFSVLPLVTIHAYFFSDTDRSFSFLLKCTGVYVLCVGGGLLFDSNTVLRDAPIMIGFTSFMCLMLGAYEYFEIQKKPRVKEKTDVEKLEEVMKKAGKEWQKDKEQINRLIAEKEQLEIKLKESEKSVADGKRIFDNWVSQDSTDKQRRIIKIKEQEEEIERLNRKIASYQTNQNALKKREQELRATIIKETTQKKELYEAKEELKLQIVKVEETNETLSSGIKHYQENNEKIIGQQLVQMIRKTALAQRYISEMYRRGELDLDRRQELIHKTEVLQEIENKIITEKNAQILTREKRLELQTLISAFELKKSAYELQIKLDSFNKDKRDFEYNQYVERTRWEIKKSLDQFDITRQSHSLMVYADSLQDEHNKLELIRLAEKIDLDKTRAELDQFAHKLSNEKDRIEFQKIINDFDLDKQRQELVRFSNKLEYERDRNELVNLSEKLDIQRGQNELAHFANGLQIQEERHKVQVMVDNFDLDKRQTALIQARERFNNEMVSESNALQAKINNLANETKRHEVQKLMDNFNLEVREQKGAIADMKRNVAMDVRQHTLQRNMDNFNVEMKQQTHSLKVMHDKLEIGEQRFDVKTERERLNFFNKEIDYMKRAVIDDFDRKQQLLQIKADRGELSAKNQLADIRQQRMDLDSRFKDVQFTKREIDLHMNKRDQELTSRELNYKQQALFSIYDQLEKETPNFVKKVFSNIGYKMTSPYKQENEKLRNQNARLKSEILK